MSKELNMNKIYSIIIFQRKIKFIMSELKQFNTKVDFLIDLLINLLNNLSKINSFKIFANTDSTFLKILTFLKNIKENLLNIPTPLKIRHLLKKKISAWQYDIFKLTELFTQVFYYIGPDNISYILKHFYNKNWIKYLNDNETFIIIQSRRCTPIYCFLKRFL